jgi:hypothetical protein
MSWFLVIPFIVLAAIMVIVVTALFCLFGIAFLVIAAPIIAVLAILFSLLDARDKKRKYL